MTLDFSVILVYDFGLLSQNLRPCHMGKCHVGSKADMTREKTSQNEFWPAKAHIASSLFVGHKLVLTDIAWPIILFTFFGLFFQPTQF